ncbi:MAG: polysaccharide ABC transporter ATP-binding protein [Bacteroidota bacterium]|nr:polysaccharide ABC transporter ATP-binding protein [Bacteroidota bacterium]
MSDIAIKVENLSKQYRLGVVGTGTISHDLNRWWARIRGKEDPFLKIGETNDRSKAGNSDYVWSLKDINFEVRQGEVLGIIGKNGAGKSTLLKILSKVTGPTTGKITAFGRIGALLEVGTGFHPELTGRENIFLNGAILGMTKAEIKSKLDEIVDFSGCARYVDTPVKRYSSGMKVRLAFAVAAFLEPEILIVDEVLAVGDAEFQKKAIGKMQDVSKGEGRTVLFVSHNMAAVESLCSRVLVLENGLIHSSGDVQSMISVYQKITLQSAKRSLSERTDREGNQLASFTFVQFNQNQPVLVGQALEIELIIFSQKEFNSVQIAITICRGFEERVVVIDTISQGVPVKLKKGENKVKIKWPEVLLIPNEYQVNLWLEANNEVLDYIISAATFDIPSSDYYKSGFMLNSNKHGVMVAKKCLWSQ